MVFLIPGFAKSQAQKSVSSIRHIAAAEKLQLTLMGFLMWQPSHGMRFQTVGSSFVCVFDYLNTILYFDKFLPQDMAMFRIATIFCLFCFVHTFSLFSFITKGDGYYG
jgi:hypothetical protein